MLRDSALAICAHVVGGPGGVGTFRRASESHCCSGAGSGASLWWQAAPFHVANRELSVIGGRF